jgi:hypothetical protein
MKRSRTGAGKQRVESGAHALAGARVAAHPEERVRLVDEQQQPLVARLRTSQSVRERGQLVASSQGVLCCPPADPSIPLHPMCGEVYMRSSRRASD